MDRKCYTVKEVMDILGVSRPSIYALLKQEAFRYAYVGRKYLIFRDSFDAWMKGTTESDEREARAQAENGSESVAGAAAGRLADFDVPNLSDDTIKELYKLLAAAQLQNIKRQL